MPKVRVEQVQAEEVPIPEVPLGRNAMENMTEEIRLRAYAIFEERGGTLGHELEDWTRAENEVLNRVFEPNDTILIPGPAPGPGVPATLEMAGIASGQGTPP